MSLWPKWYSPPVRVRMPADEMLARAAQFYGFSIGELRGGARGRDLVKARSVVAKILRERGLSYPSIARLVGRRDHTTIMHLMETYADREKYNPDMLVLYQALKLPETKAERLAA